MRSRSTAEGRRCTGDVRAGDSPVEGESRAAIGAIGDARFDSFTVKCMCVPRCSGDRVEPRDVGA